MLLFHIFSESPQNVMEEENAQFSAGHVATITQSSGMTFNILPLIQCGVNTLQLARDGLFSFLSLSPAGYYCVLSIMIRAAFSLHLFLIYAGSHMVRDT